MKKFIILLIIIVTSNILNAKSIVITASKFVNDYYISNEVYKELKNSKYYYLFNDYVDAKKGVDLSNYDYEVEFSYSYLDNTYFGMITLYKILMINNRIEAIYRNCVFFYTPYSSREEKIREFKNSIIEWIEEGYIDY